MRFRYRNALSFTFSCKLNSSHFSSVQRAAFFYSNGNKMCSTLLYSWNKIQLLSLKILYAKRLHGLTEWRVMVTKECVVLIWPDEKISDNVIVFRVSSKMLVKSLMCPFWKHFKSFKHIFSLPIPVHPVLQQFPRKEEQPLFRFKLVGHQAVQFHCSCRKKNTWN